MKPVVGFITVVLLLILIEGASVYLIMPFPGSQLDDVANIDRVKIAYWFHNNIGWLRVLGLVLLLYSGYRLLRQTNRVGYRYLVGGLGLTYGAVLYLINSQMMADHMFLQPTSLRMVSMKQNMIPANKLVLGIVERGQARAYPLQLIGYHHQVRDTVGGKPLMITYCTVCRTGRVFDPLVNGRSETFRLVGMDHFNAMFEDERTGSWWRQATGEAILGPQAGQVLTELPTRQMTLKEWAGEHPATLVMQADPAFRAETDSLATYDLGERRGKLTGRDSASWRPKSWVVGVVVGKQAKAFDWNELVKQHVVNETVGQQPIVLVVAPDQLSYGVFGRLIAGQTLTFSPASDGRLTDRETGTVWNRDGRAVAGPLTGKQLTPQRAYQEFWHSWQSFHS